MRIAGGIFFLSVVFLTICTSGTSYAQERIALVVGNSNYEHADALPNPKNDADAIGDALEKVGFTVTTHIDLDQRDMQAALRDFGLKAETADIALVYFAGHGIQVASQNYLLPTDAQLRRERDLIYEATPLSIVMAEVAQARQLGMVILDACRDNPLAENLRQSLGPVRSKLIGLGMARVEDVPPDTLIAFSTRFNQLAYDGAGELSPFTSALVKHIQEPGLELNLFFRKVRDTVLDITANRQEPRTLDALGAKPFYFTAPKSNQPPELGELNPLIVEDGAGATNVQIGAPSDADKDGLTIEVMGLPTFGAIESDGEAVTFGDELTIEELRALTYDPTQGKIGEAGAFLFVVRDGQGGVTAGRVPIDVVRSNEVPVVPEPHDLVWLDIPLGIEVPTDPDNDPMEITVTAVPTLGEVKDGGEVVGVGDKLTVEALAALTFDPSTGAAGEFAYDVADDHGGVSSSSVRLRLPGPGLAALADEIFAETAPAPVDGNDRSNNAVQTANANLNLQTRNTTPEANNTGEATRAEPPKALEAAKVSFLETLTASNIRSGPGSENGWIAEVPAGAQLKLIEKVEGRNWYEIELLDGTSGYIAGSLVRMIGSQAFNVAALTQQPAEPVAEPVEKKEKKYAAVDAATALEVDEFIECENCPAMVALPEGRFQMGSVDGDPAEQPVRDVAIEQPIAMGKYEVTLGQWQSCVNAGFCRPISDPGPDDDKRPAQNISWADAESFVAWLRKETEQAYRLPTEAEWEYAARAGSSARFWWGDLFENGRANCSECGDDWNRKRPSNIGSYEPNSFGLYDMHGGVSEWVADCWVGNYLDAPGNGTARALSFCPQRVLRGGSWRSDVGDVTASSRFRYDAQVRYYTNGFRVARDLN